jgi:hypothetical protein
MRNKVVIIEDKAKHLQYLAGLVSKIRIPIDDRMVLVEAIEFKSTSDALIELGQNGMADRVGCIVLDIAIPDHSGAGILFMDKLLPEHRIPIVVVTRVRESYAEALSVPHMFRPFFILDKPVEFPDEPPSAGVSGPSFPDVLTQTVMAGCYASSLVPDQLADAPRGLLPYIVRLILDPSVRVGPRLRPLPALIALGLIAVIVVGYAIILMFQKL